PPYPRRRCARPPPRTAASSRLVLVEGFLLGDLGARERLVRVEDHERRERPRELEERGRHHGVRDLRLASRRHAGELEQEPEERLVVVRPLDDRRVAGDAAAPARLGERLAEAPELVDEALRAALL